jgi:hypothetical protein
MTVRPGAAVSRKAQLNRDRQGERRRGMTVRPGAAVSRKAQLNRDRQGQGASICAKVSGGGEISRREIRAQVSDQKLT